MDQPQHLDETLLNWPYDPTAVSVRVVQGRDERDIIQMRVELGVLQLETTGRPDGWKPEGDETYFDHLIKLEISNKENLVLTEDQCLECDREFVQFYHRRICWLALQRYEEAVHDADHTLGLMDFCRRHSPDEEWTMTHEQYRPFVLYHRIQAGAMASISDDEPELAVEAINNGLDQLRQIYVEHEIDGDEFEDDELVARLIELRESLRDQFDVGRTLRERLHDAVASEQYELAARLRDEIGRRHPSQPQK